MSAAPDLSPLPGYAEGCAAVREAVYRLVDAMPGGTLALDVTALIREGRFGTARQLAMYVERLDAVTNAVVSLNDFLNV
jgi:hypothetical protein